MLEFLKDHPFAVEAHFKESLVLTFAAPAEELAHRIPECLTLDTFKDQWAFIAIAMVQTQGLRPKGFPRFMGNDFFLIGYRIFVRYHTNAGKRLRGLYILKSETNRKKMERLGNLFTHYNYSTTDIGYQTTGTVTELRSERSRFHFRYDDGVENAPLPSSSPFSEWKEARRFAGPLPFTFTYTPEQRKVLIIEGVRQNWTPQPLHVLDYDFDFLNQLNINGLVLANAFSIRNIPYHWKKGRVEIWQG